MTLPDTIVKRKRFAVRSSPTVSEDLNVSDLLDQPVEVLVALAVFGLGVGFIMLTFVIGFFSR